ncbi:hypothetical protein V8E51_004083 [Hyaloscypha variabilis]
MVAPTPIRHAISPLTGSPRTDITVGPVVTIPWELVRQRANQALSELLLLMLFLVLTIIRFLRGTESSSSLPRSSPLASSLRPSVSSSLRPSAPAPALSVKPLASLDSFRILAKLGVVDESLLPPSPPPSSPSPSSYASSTSPRPYVPPHVRRQPSVPRSLVPRPVSASSPDSPASLRPPLVRTHPSSLKHIYQNHYPWFHHHLAPSTVAQGEQVKRRTDGTEWDKDVLKRPSNPVVFGTSFGTRF